MSCAAGAGAGALGMSIERALGLRLPPGLSPEELRTWIEDLSELNVAAAVERVRRLIGTVDNKGGAS